MQENLNNEIDLVELAKSLWSARKKIITWGICGFVVGVIIAFSTPKEYTSIVKVAPESQSKSLGGSAGTLASMMGLSGVNNYDGLNEKVYPEIISSTPFLLEFADIEVVYDKQVMPLSDYLLEHTKSPWWSAIMGVPGTVIGWVMSIGAEKTDTLTIKNSPQIQYDFTGSMSSGIDIKLDPKLGIITITSTFQDKVITKMISDSLIVKLQRYMTTYRTAKTKANLEVTQKMLEEAQHRYYQADEHYAQVIDRNKNIVVKSASVVLNRLGNERDLAYQVYSQLASQVEATRVKLLEETPIVSVIEPASTPIKPSAPRKSIIAIAFAFLGGVCASGIVMCKFIFSKK